MLKKGIKLVSIFLIIFLIMNIVLTDNKCFATSIDVTENLDYWGNVSITDDNELFDTAIKSIISVVRIVGMVVSVITLSIIGLKFMLGSVEEKAQYKQTLYPWLIGAIMVFAITFIPSLIYDMAKGLF